MDKLYRSRRDRKITGLCGGLAEAFNVDANILRIVVVLTTIFSSGMILFVYIVASMVIPKEPGYETPAFHSQSTNFGTMNNNMSQQPPFTTPPQQPPTQTQFFQGGKRSVYRHDVMNPPTIDELMKQIELKEMRKELDDLRAKLAELESSNNKTN